MFSEVATFLAAVPEGRVFAIDTQALISTGIVLINACILAFALTKILYKPVRNFMRKRTERFAAQFDKAEEETANAGRMKAEYEEKLKDIERERIDVLDEARKVAAEERTKMLEEARREITALKDRAASGIETERERMKDEMSVYILEASLAIAGKFVSHSMDKETQDSLFRQTIAELEETEWLS